MQWTIEFTDQTQTGDWKFVWDQLREYNLTQAEDDRHQWLAIYARDDAGKLVGGLLGGTYWSWLHIDILWIREDARRSGLGSQLLASAEAEAVRRGCRHAQVDTHDFQAPEFYKKHGYTIWGVLEDLPPGHRRIYLKKDLA